MARGFVVIQVIEVTDPDRYARYRQEVAGIVAAHGGRFIVGRESRRRALEGDWDPHVFVIIEFPSYAAAEGWYFSQGYQAGLPHRLGGTVSKALLAEEQMG